MKGKSFVSITTRQKQIADWLSKNQPLVVRAYTQSELTDQSVVALLKDKGQIAKSTYWKDVRVEKIMQHAKGLEEFDRLTDSPKPKCPHCGRAL